MQAASHANTSIHFIALLIAYTLIISLLAPFAIKRAQAAADLESGGRENAPTIGNPKGKSSPNSSAQASGQRPGELLVRFREGLSEQAKATAVSAHGGRRKRQLRGESGIEKLEVVAGQDMETVALQLRMNPAVEFAEPNFLIKRDDLRPDPNAIKIARSFNPTTQPMASGLLNPIRPAPYLEAFGSKPEASFSNSPAPNTAFQSQSTQPDDPRFGEQWALSNAGQNNGNRRCARKAQTG